MKRRIAFTLVELLVVIGIIALLVSILLPSLSKARQQANLTACMAQLRDIGNAVAMYVNDNKGSYPGPGLGRIPVNYSAYYTAAGAGTPSTTDYLRKYFHYPDPPADGTPVVAKVFYCPGVRATNAGTYDESKLCAYGFVACNWDPYPWFGYYNTQPFPLRIAKVGTVTMVNALGQTSQQVAPMKASQVWEPQSMALIGDVDVAQTVYQSGGLYPSYAAAVAGQLAQTESAIPAHGGKPELRPGVQEKGGGAFYVYIDKTAATNPPRNYLFADGHVQTVRRSEPVLPGQFVTRYGPKPSGWTIGFNAVLN